MSPLILSKEFDDVVFLRFNENKIIDCQKDNFKKLFDEIKKAGRKFVIVDFSAINKLDDDVLTKIKNFSDDISMNFFWKLCFCAQNENICEKIKIVCNDRNLKYFRNISDAINYFYWDCYKIRETIKMKMPSDILLVPSVRTCVSDFISVCKADRKTVFQIELIIDELCNNAIEHGAKDLNKTIEVQCCVNEKHIEISVYNGYSSRTEKEKMGHKIRKDMEKWADSPSQTINEFRGRGLSLVKRYSDSFEINSSNDGTWVYVVKKKEG